MRKISRYFKGVAEEAHRVRWPNSKELWTAVAIVMVVVVVCCLVLVLCDYVSYLMIDAFRGQVPTSDSSSSSGSGDISAVEAAWRLIGAAKTIVGGF